MKKSCYIVLTYNNDHDTIETLDGILSQSIADKMDTIVIDNASYKEYRNKVEKYCRIHNIQYYYRKENDGYAGGNNYAWEKLKTDYDYMFIVNNDIVFNSKRISEKIIKIFNQHPEIGAIGPVVKTGNNEIAKDCAIFNVFFGKQIFGHKYHRTKEFHERYAVVGCFIANNVKAIDRNYLFNKSFFMYSEELELCLRIWKRGFRVAALNNDRYSVYHKGGKDPFEKGGEWKFYLASRNLALCAKEFEIADKIFFLILQFASVMKRVFCGPGNKRERISSLRGYMKGLYFVLARSNADQIYQDACDQLIRI